MVVQRWMVALYVSLLLLFGSAKGFAAEAGQDTFDSAPTVQGLEQDAKVGKFQHNLQLALDAMLKTSAAHMNANDQKAEAANILKDWTVAQQYLARGSNDDIVKVSRWLLGIWNSINASVDPETINKYRLYGIGYIAEGLIYVLAPENTDAGYQDFVTHYVQMSGPITWWITYGVCKKVIKMSQLQIICEPAAGIAEGLMLDKIAPATAKKAYDTAIKIRASRH